jgi:hypothetical protein
LAPAYFLGVIQHAVEDLVVEPAPCTTINEPVCDVAKAGAVRPGHRPNYAALHFIEVQPSGLRVLVVTSQ